MGYCRVSLFLVLFLGCQKIPEVAIQQPIQPASAPRAVLLKKVVAKPQRGKRIGTIYGGLAHVPQTSLIWKGGRIAFDPTEYSDELRSQFEAHGYAVVGDPEALFEDPSEWKAEFLIGALLKDIKLDLWYPMAGYGNYNSGSGTGYLEVEWQLYNRRLRKVQLEIVTKGSAHDVKITDLGPSEPLLQAFGAATRNLLAQPDFAKLVAPAEDTITEEQVPPIGIALTKAQDSTGPSEEIIDRARMCVITLFAGESLGSGFIISGDGYALTNQHVVGNARTITAKTVTGRELLGEVVRVDRRRDVALVKLERDKYNSLALGTTASVRPGTDVYAIGAPIREQLGQSVSRGVVSGFRVIDDLRYIQSDAAVNPGNSGGPLLTSDGRVVGIAVMKLSPAESLNFFVPIEEALERLAIVSDSEDIDK